MAKSPKDSNTKKKELTDFSVMFYLSAVILIVFLVYSLSLTRGWIPFDESFFYNQEFLPFPLSINEIPEIIRNFVLNAHIISMNSFFSNLVTLRNDPLAWSILVFIFYFFRDNAFLYHCLLLFIHLLNTTLVWFIFLSTSKFLFSSSKTSPLSPHFLILIALLTTIWGVHSASSEAVLLTTNWNALLIYSFCFGFILYEILNITKKRFEVSKFEMIFIPLLFFLAMSIVEFGYTLPVILFFMIFAFSLKITDSTKDSLIISLKRTLPYFIGLALFVIYLLIKPGSSFINLFSTQKSIYLFLERNLWLTPQIFIHFLKLLFFPKTLSAYQSNLIHLSDELFSPYSVFCFIAYLSFLILPIVLFILFKKSKNRFLCPLVYCFYFAIFPFIHILAPTYCLGADRYCYFPSFLLIFFILNSLFSSKQKKSKLLIALLSCILLTLGTRTFIRIQDWRNPISFYNSAIKADKKFLYKGLKFLLLADFFDSQKMKSQMDDSIKQALSEFNIAMKDLKSLKEKHPTQLLTLRLYGLDYDSLLLKTAHGIAIIKKSYLKDSISDIVHFFEPYIEKRLDYSAPNEIAFYGDILLKNSEFEKIKYVYEYGYKRFPFVLDISLPLADFYLTHENNPDKSFQILQESYKYYPNKGMPMYKLLKYYEQKNDLGNQAEFAYLLGLRDHSIESYQHAAQMYLDLNKLANAKKALTKLILLNPNNPLTLLQLSRYMDLMGDRTRILDTLNKAYFLNKRTNTNEAFITKAILVSLINVNYRFGNLENAKKYLYELETMKDLSLDDIRQIKSVKERLEIK